MTVNQAKRRNVGLVAGLLFLICFLTLPLIGGCDGSEILRLNIEASGRDNNFMVIILVLLLITVAIGTLLYLKLKFDGAWVSGLLAITASTAALITAEASPSDFDSGAWICLVLLGLFTIAAKVPDRYFVWVPNIGGSDQTDLTHGGDK